MKNRATSRQRITRTCLLLALSSPLLHGETTSEQERDREAILAMAGEFEVEYNFMETVPVKAGYERSEPYHEDAEEIVFLVEDSPERIVLQHVLWVDSHSRVVKHWKQEWRFQDRVLYEFVGDNTWQLRELSEAEARGTWTQKVWQVDDSPRYESFGKWRHEGGMSSWQGSETRRPLPRREYTKRKDYDTFTAINRHTLTPYGWVHEQDNFKRVSATGAVLCREVGLNKYFETTALDLGEVRDYWAKNSAYWSEVSALWETQLEGGGVRMRLRKEVDGQPLYRHLFGLAKEEGLDPAGRVSKAEKVIEKFVVREEQTSTR